MVSEQDGRFRQEAYWPWTRGKHRSNGWTTGPTPDGNAVAVEDEAQPQPALSEPKPETASLVIQYIGDVRQFALLTRAEEEALWQHIEHLKKRVRRALYTAPICLPTLQKLWQRVERGELSLRHVVAETPSITDPDPRAGGAIRSVYPVVTRADAASPAPQDSQAEVRGPSVSSPASHAAGVCRRMASVDCHLRSSRATAERA